MQGIPAVIACDKLLESTDCYLLHCAHHWSLGGCSYLSMLCVVSSLHTDDGVATPDGSSDCLKLSLLSDIENAQPPSFHSVAGHCC